MTKRIKDGTVKNAKDIDWSGDVFGRSADTDPGIYIYFGMWKGPFDSKETAKSCYREWACEARYS